MTARENPTSLLGAWTNAMERPSGDQDGSAAPVPGPTAGLCVTWRTRVPFARIVKIFTRTFLPVPVKRANAMAFPSGDQLGERATVPAGLRASRLLVRRAKS